MALTFDLELVGLPTLPSRHTPSQQLFVLYGPALRLTVIITARHLYLIGTAQFHMIQTQTGIHMYQMLVLITPLLVVVIVVHAGYHLDDAHIASTMWHGGAAELVAQHLGVGQCEEL